MQKRALVVGLGIAGMSAAVGLRRAGWTPVIIERAPERRTGGYFINLTPEGVKAAGDLGLDTLHTRYPEHGTTWSSRSAWTAVRAPAASLRLGVRKDRRTAAASDSARPHVLPQCGKRRGGRVTVDSRNSAMREWTWRIR